MESFYGGVFLIILAATVFLIGAFCAVISRGADDGSRP